jgi:hypothetical protein
MTRTFALVVAAIALLGVGAAQGQTAPKPAAKTEKDDEAKKLEQFYGIWREKKHDGAYVISPLAPSDPQSKDLVKLRGRFATWEDGQITLGKDSQPTRLKFSYKPKWSEMNPTIPEWARRRIEGKLEWKLELETVEKAEQCSCSCIAVAGSWYPGEVRWKDEGDPEAVRVTGRGDPVKIELRHAKPMPLVLVFVKTRDDPILVEHFYGDVPHFLGVFFDEPCNDERYPLTVSVGGQTLDLEATPFDEERKRFDTGTFKIDVR